jgi:sortase (surface protein transpeptidase)
MVAFYNLDKLSNGDWIVLKDSLGTPYEYQVSKSFVVEPDAE